MNDPVAAATLCFAERQSVEQVEHGLSFAPKFDANGLIPAIVMDSETRSVLMLGYMNAEAVKLTLASRQAHFWSRSREQLWRKGEHSGFTQRVEKILVDDDQDALIVEVKLDGPGSCHVGYKSCFYRQIELDALARSAEENSPPLLSFVENSLSFDADAVYAGLPNPTKL